MNKIVRLIGFILLIISLVLFFKYNKEDTKTESENNVVSTVENNVTNEQEQKPVEIQDDNPIKLGIYLSNASDTKRDLMTEYSNKWVYYNDIVVFNTIFTDKDEIEGGKTKACFAKYYENYDEDISDYRVGFHIHFKTEDEEFDKTILSPKDTEEFFEFLEVYLYDGYHRKDNEWYSHTTEAQFNKETLFTSIKLTTGKKVKEITSDIELDAFTYDNTNKDDFDEKGNYIGKCKASVVVKQEK